MKALTNSKATRNNLFKFLENLSIDELNKIPKGYKNNVFWNIAHVVVTQQLLIYKLSGLKMYLSDAYVDEFKKGTAPSKKYSIEDVDFLKSVLLSLVDELEADIDKSIFEHYKDYSTSYGIVLTSAEDAVEFNNIHEGLHLGYIMAMKKHL